MDVTRWVRKHRQEVEIRPVCHVRGVVEAGRGPALPPFLFDGGGRIAIDLLLHFARHVDLLSAKQKAFRPALARSGALPLGTKDLRGTTPIESLSLVELAGFEPATP